MNIMKKAATAALALTLTMSAAVSTVDSLSAIKASAFYSKGYSMMSIRQNWTQFQNEEMAKFPQTKNGKQCYWNSGNPNSYTQTANGTKDNSFTAPFQYFDGSTFRFSDNRYIVGVMEPTDGFAAKLQSDLFQTPFMARTEISSCQYTAVDGKKYLYEPRIGDVVSITVGNRYYSVFVTYVSGNTVKVTYCDGNNSCAIHWNVSSIDGKTITTAYLQSYADWFDRPLTCGDLNLDNKITSADATIFDTTMGTYGNTIGDCPRAVYDVNNDNRVDEKDSNAIRYTSSIETIPIAQDDVTSYRWNEMDSNGFRFSDGSYYIKNSSGGVTFLGLSDSTVKNYTMMSRVYNSNDKKYYDVTEIGYSGLRGPSNSALKNISTLTIAPTVKKINSYAFYNCNLTELKIPTNSDLTYIDNYAFNGAHVSKLDLSSATKLTSVGTYVFANNTSLINLTLPYSLVSLNTGACSNCNQLTQVTVMGDRYHYSPLKEIGNYAFEGCTQLRRIDLPNNNGTLKLGLSAATFSSNPMNVCTLYLPNDTGTARTIVLRGNDVTLFKNRKLLINCGRCIIKDQYGNELGRNNSISNTTVTPR